MELELENKLLLNQNRNQLQNEQNNFLKSAFGTALNLAVDYGLKKVLPDFIEEQVIEIKDVLLNNGLREGLNTAVDKVVDLGKSVVGIFNGDFKKVSQVETVVKKGGLIDEMSEIFDKTLKNIKDKEIISSDLNNLIKGSKNMFEKSLDENISSVLKEQNKIINNIDKCIEKWEQYRTEKDFEKMEKEYEKIKNQMEQVIPLEETLQKYNELENLHSLIKNNGQNFELSNLEKEMAIKI